MTASENALAKILDRASELQAQCESCCAQLNGTEVRLKTLLRTRHDLLANPGEGVRPFPVELIEQSAKVRSDLSEIQKARIAIESKIRYGLAERRKIQSELLSLDARGNERAARLEELRRKVELEFAEDPHREELQRHLEDLQRQRATASDAVVESPTPSAAPSPRSTKKKPSILARALGAIGLGNGEAHRPPRITPLPEPAAEAPRTDRATAELDKMIQRVILEIRELKTTLKERNGLAAVESQCQSLSSKRGELLQSERTNRLHCQRLFEDWRMVEVLQGQERHKALLELGRTVESAVSALGTTSTTRGSGLQPKERLGELAEVIEASRLELERLVRNCDKTLIGLQRMMDLEVRFWSSEGEPAPTEADFELLLGDLVLEGRSAPRRRGPVRPPEAPAGADDATREDRPRFEQKKLWKEG